MSAALLGTSQAIAARLLTVPGTVKLFAHGVDPVDLLEVAYQHEVPIRFSVDTGDSTWVTVPLAQELGLDFEMSWFVAHPVSDVHRTAFENYNTWLTNRNAARARNDEELARKTAEEESDRYSDLGLDRKSIINHGPDEA